MSELADAILDAAETAHGLSRSLLVARGPDRRQGPRRKTEIARHYAEMAALEQLRVWARAVSYCAGDGATQDAWSAACAYTDACEAAEQDQT